MRATTEWLERRRAGAPPDLFDRVRFWVETVDLGGGDTEDVAVAEVLARAGRAALDQVTASDGNRTVAMDLLAADALVTFAMEACAEDAPESLARFARAMRLPPGPA